MLVEGRSAITDVPSDRVDVDGDYSSDRPNLDTVSADGHLQFNHSQHHVRYPAVIVIS
jgi:acyl transferase domain-containing protein